MADELRKKFALHKELEASIKLIELGFGEFQNLDMANDFYHLPFQLISSGFERLMKCHICLGHMEINGEFPNSKIFRFKLGHDLEKIKQHMIENYFKTRDIPALKDDLEYISKDKELNKLIKLLSEFGKSARYYNLDVVTGEKKPSIDVEALWQEFEINLLSKDKELAKKINDPKNLNEVLDVISKIIIIKLERFVRAIARQFTLGKLGKLADQYSPTVFPFLMLMELGVTDYKKQITKK